MAEVEAMQLSRTQAYKGRFSEPQAHITERADALLAHLRDGVYDDLLSLLRCDRCGAVATEWYDTGAGVEAFCECSPGNGAYHCWYRRYNAAVQR